MYVLDVMSAIILKSKILFSLLLQGQVVVVLKEIRRRFYSDEIFYWLRRDLRESFKQPDTGIALRLRPLRNEDIPKLLDSNTKYGDYQQIRDRIERVLFLKSGISTCYVAVTQHDDQPCFMQWLIGPEENKNLHAYFKGSILSLAEDEVLLEFVLIPEKFRGRKIMPFAMSLVAEEGKRHGARWGITYVPDNNIPSLRGCLSAGFVPFLVKKVKRRFFVRQVTYKPFNEEFANTFFNDAMQGKQTSAQRNLLLP